MSWNFMLETIMELGLGGKMARKNWEAGRHNHPSFWNWEEEEEEMKKR